MYKRQAVGFTLPWASLKSDASSVNFDIIGVFTDGFSMIDLFKSFFGNSGLYFTNMGYENYSGPITYTMLSMLFMVLSALLIVIAFFLIIFTFKHSKTKAMFVFDVLSVLSAIVSAILFTVGAKSASGYQGFNFGDMAMYNASGSVQWGFFVALALLLVASGINLAVALAPAKSDETLEEERLARKAVKDLSLIHI